MRLNLKYAKGPMAAPAKVTRTENGCIIEMPKEMSPQLKMLYDAHRIAFPLTKEDYLCKQVIDRGYRPGYVPRSLVIDLGVLSSAIGKQLEFDQRYGKEQTLQSISDMIDKGQAYASHGYIHVNKIDL